VIRVDTRDNRRNVRNGETTTSTFERALPVSPSWETGITVESAAAEQDVNGTSSPSTSSRAKQSTVKAYE